MMNSKIRFTLGIIHAVFSVSLLIVMFVTGFDNLVLWILLLNAIVAFEYMDNPQALTSKL